MINDYFATIETLFFVRNEFIFSVLSLPFFFPMSSERVFKATLNLNLKAFDSIESIVGTARTDVYLTFN